MLSWAHLGIAGSFGVLLSGWLVVVGCSIDRASTYLINIRDKLKQSNVYIYISFLERDRKDKLLLLLLAFGNLSLRHLSLLKLRMG